MIPRRRGAPYTQRRAVAALVVASVLVGAGVGVTRLAALVGDGDGTPSRGQVALLENPGLGRWVVDDEFPDGMVYALPHPGWVVCGGTDVLGTWDTEPDPEVHEAILERVRTVVPELAGARVLGARVGLRPVAPAVSLVAAERGGRLVVTNHGHGGAGVAQAQAEPRAAQPDQAQRPPAAAEKRPAPQRRAPAKTAPQGGAGHEDHSNHNH